MLIMRRRAGESFVIAGGIEIEILEIGGSRVKLGIVAPDNLEIVRKEVHATGVENLAAAALVAPDAIVSLARYLSDESGIRVIAPAIPESRQAVDDNKGKSLLANGR